MPRDAQGPTSLRKNWVSIPARTPKTRFPPHSNSICTEAGDAVVDERPSRCANNPVAHVHSIMRGQIMKTDRELQKDVVEELGWDPSVDAASVGVEVKDGIVTLSGSVDSVPQRWAAERAALRVAGVKGVVIDIDVDLPGSH